MSTSIYISKYISNHVKDWLSQFHNFVASNSFSNHLIKMLYKSISIESITPENLSKSKLNPESISQMENQFEYQVIEFQKNNATWIRSMTNLGNISNRSIGTNGSLADISLFFQELKRIYLNPNNNNNEKNSEQFNNIIICILILSKSLIQKGSQDIKTIAIDSAISFIYRYSIAEAKDSKINFKDLITNKTSSELISKEYYPILLSLVNEGIIIAFLKDIVKSHRETIPYFVDSVLELIYRHYDKFYIIWNRFNVIFFNVFSDQYVNEVYNHMPNMSQDVNTIDSMNRINNEMSEIQNLNRNDDISFSESLNVNINIHRNHLKDLESFFLKTYILHQLTILCNFLFNTSEEKYCLEILEKLIQLLPLFDLFSKESDLRFSNLKPLQEILNVYFILFDQFKKNSTKITDTTMPDTATKDSTTIEDQGTKLNNITFKIISHLFSLLDELKCRNDIQSESSILSIIHLIFNMYNFVPEFSILFLPFVCKYILTSSSHKQSKKLFQLLEISISHLSLTLDNLTKVYCSSFEFIFLSLYMVQNTITFIQAYQKEDQSHAKIYSLIEKILTNNVQIEIVYFELFKMKDVNIYLRRDLLYHLNSIENFSKTHFYAKQSMNNNISLNSKHFQSKNLLPKEQLCHWLVKLRHRLSLKEKSGSNQDIHTFGPTFFILILGSILISLHNHDDQHLVLKLLPLCNYINEQLFGLLFQANIFKLLLTIKNIKIKKKMLLTLPRIGTQTDSKIVISRIIKIAQIISESDETFSIGLKILFTLWKENDKCFSVLKDTLYRGSKYGKSSFSKSSLQSRMTIATTILEISKINPVRGLRLISVLSQLLCQEQEPSVLIVGIEAMQILCDSELLDFFTAYFYVVRENIEHCLSKSKDLEIALCKLFSCARREFYIPDEIENQIVQKGYNDDDLEFTSDYNEEIYFVLNYLFERAYSTNKSISSAALKSFSDFPLPAILYFIERKFKFTQNNDSKQTKNIETKGIKDLKNPNNSNNPNDLIESDLIAKRKKNTMILTDKLNKILKIQNENPLALNSCSLLLLKLMDIEMKGINGSKVENKKISKSNNIQDRIKNFLEFSFHHKKTDKSITRYNQFWILNPQMDNIQSFEIHLKDLIINSRLSESFFLGWATYSLYFNGVTRIIKNYYQCVYKHFENSSKKESRLIHQNTFYHIFEFLQSLSKENTSSYLILYLCAFSLEIPIQLHNQIQVLISFLEDIISKKDINSMSELSIMNYSLASSIISMLNHLTSKSSSIVAELEKAINDLDNILHSNNIIETEKISEIYFISNAVKYLFSIGSIHSTSDKNKIKNIANLLIRLCFSTANLKENTKNFEISQHFVTKLNTNQSIALFLTLGSICQILSDIDERKELINIYNTYLIYIQILLEKLRSNSYKNESSDNLNAMRFFQALIYSLPLLLKGYKDSSKLSEISELIQDIITTSKDDPTIQIQWIHICSSATLGALKFMQLNNNTINNLFKFIEDNCEIINNSNLGNNSKFSSLILLLGSIGLDFYSIIHIDNDGSNKFINIENLLERNITQPIETSSSKLISLILSSCQGYIMNISNNSSFRIFSAISLGSVSEYYAIESSSTTSISSQIAIDQIPNDSISMNLIQITKNLNISNIHLLNLSLELWTKNSKNPLFTLSELQSFLLTNEDKISNFTNLFSNYLRLICSDIEGGGSNSLKILLEICSSKLYKKENSKLLEVLINNIILLIETLPPEKSSKFIKKLFSHITNSFSLKNKLNLLKNFQTTPKNTLPSQVVTSIIEQLQILYKSLPEAYNHIGKHITIDIPTCLILKEYSKVRLTSHFFERSIFNNVDSFNDSFVLCNSLLIDPTNISTVISRVYDWCKTENGYKVVHIIGSMFFDVLQQLNNDKIVICIETLLKRISFDINQQKINISQDNIAQENQKDIQFLSYILSSWSDNSAFILNGLYEIGFFSDLEFINESFTSKDLKQDKIYLFKSSDMINATAYMFIHLFTTMRHDAFRFFDSYWTKYSKQIEESKQQINPFLISLLHNMRKEPIFQLKIESLNQLKGFMLNK